MTQAARLSLRMHKELKLLLSDPPPGASFPSLTAAGDADASASLAAIDAEIEGPEGTVYAGGIFKIKIQIPERYPFQPPTLTFATPIYHPNIDNGGRICLDILNLPPKGAWQPSLNISTVITSIGLLLSEPNPDDGLMCEASREFKYNRQAFDLKARTMTEKYAKSSGDTASSSQVTMPAELGLISNEEAHEESRSGGGGCTIKDSKSLGLCRKLSLDSSVSHCKKDSNGDTNRATDHISSTLHNKKMQCEEQRSNQLKRTNDVVTLGDSKFTTSKRKLSLGFPSQLKQRDLDNVGSLVGQHISHFPQGSYNGGTSEEKAITADDSLMLNNGSKKLSLGFSSKSRNPKKVENESLKPVQKLTLESPHKSGEEFSFASKMPEVAHQISLGGSSVNTDLNEIKCVADQIPAKEALENLHDSGGGNCTPSLECQDRSVLGSASLAVQKSKQQTEASPTSSIVVVLDSDESDQEETTECRRSRLSLLRKRASTRECKLSSRPTSKMPT